MQLHGSSYSKYKVSLRQAPGGQSRFNFQSVFFTGVLIFRIASTDQRMYSVNNQKNLERISVAST